MWQPGKKVGLFGFSRGAYTVRCLGGVLATCGVATNDGGAPISHARDGLGAKRRREIADKAVATYKFKDNAARKSAGSAFATQFGAAPVVPDVIGVFDTVKSLGLPGVMNLANPWKHEFHDDELSVRVPVGLQALSVDENRKAFAPELWADVDAGGQATGQVIDQVWFPGAHSDIGGGYEDDRRLADLTLDWMLDRLRNVARLHIPLTVAMDDNLWAKAHDERTGFSKLWLHGERDIRAESTDVASLCRDIERRFDHPPLSYRPKPLRRHPRVTGYY